MASNASPILRSLSRDLETISHDMRGLLDGGYRPTSTGHALTLFPKINSQQTEESYLFSIFLPGVKKEDIELAIEGRHITVSGTRLSQIPEGATVKINERFQGRFRRLMSLPKDADLSTTSASYTDGILKVEVKRALPERTVIEIEDGGAA